MHATIKETLFSWFSRETQEPRKGIYKRALEVAHSVKSLPEMQETWVQSIPGSGRVPGEGNGNLLQYSCLENPVDGGAWQATVRGFAKSQT